MVGFGDDSLGHSLNTTQEAHAKLSSKRHETHDLHMDRLRYAGLAPEQEAAPTPTQPSSTMGYRHVPEHHFIADDDHAEFLEPDYSQDPAEVGVESFDHPRPEHLPPIPTSEYGSASEGEGGGVVAVNAATQHQKDPPELEG